MPDSPALKAFVASTLALMLSLLCAAQFLPPFVEQTTASVPRTVFTALALATSMLLHWAFLGIGVRRAGRSVGFWVIGMAVLLFPIGGAAALILLGWLSSEAASPAPAPHPG